MPSIVLTPMQKLALCGHIEATNDYSLDSICAWCEANGITLSRPSIKNYMAEIRQDLKERVQETYEKASEKRANYIVKGVSDFLTVLERKAMKCFDKDDNRLGIALAKTWLDFAVFNRSPVIQSIKSEAEAAGETLCDKELVDRIIAKVKNGSNNKPTSN